MQDGEGYDQIKPIYSIWLLVLFLNKYLGKMMASESLFHLPNSLRMGLLIAVLVGLLISALAWFQIERERRNDLEEMDRRAYVIAHQMAYPAQVALQLPDSEATTAFGSMLEGYRRLIGREPPVGQ